MRGITLSVWVGRVLQQAVSRKSTLPAWCLAVSGRYILQRNSEPWKYCPVLEAGDLHVVSFGALLKTCPCFLAETPGFEHLNLFWFKNWTWHIFFVYLTVLWTISDMFKTKQRSKTTTQLQTFRYLWPVMFNKLDSYPPPKKK